MSDEQEPEEQVPRRGGGLVMWIMTVLLSAGTGLAAPFAYSYIADVDDAPESPAVPFELLPADETTVVEFGEITVNLDEGRMNRYLRLKIVMLIAKADEKRVNEEVEKQRLILRSWLLSHLSDKTLEGIRGKAGQNMLRREIRKQFNETLFSDRRDRIYDILFEEFNIQ